MVPQVQKCKLTQSLHDKCNFPYLSCSRLTNCEAVEKNLRGCERFGSCTESQSLMQTANAVLDQHSTSTSSETQDSESDESDKIHILESPDLNPEGMLKSSIRRKTILKQNIASYAQYNLV